MLEVCTRLSVVHVVVSCCVYLRLMLELIFLKRLIYLQTFSQGITENPEFVPFRLGGWSPGFVTLMLAALVPWRASGWRMFIF